MSVIAVFRADASQNIGSGHIMRCLALAEELLEMGIDCHFISNNCPEHLKKLIEKKGFKVHLISLKGNYKAGRLNTPWEEDAEQCLEILQSLKDSRYEINWLVVDHYQLDFSWEKIVKEKVPKVLVIDDLGNRAHDCEVLLDQNNDCTPAKYQSLVTQKTKLIYGSKFALLNKAFRNSRKNITVRDGTIKRILISFGGSDSTNETIKVLEAIQSLKLEQISIDVVIGPLFAEKEKIISITAAIDNVKIYENCTNLSLLMLQCDLAFGSAGVTLLERCCLGLPSIVVSAASNQEGGACAAAEQGACIYLGKALSTTANEYAHATNMVLKSPWLLKAISKNSLQITDGRGALRVAHIMCPLKITLRIASQNDSAKIFAWRNSFNVRKFSFNQEIIAWEDHCRWFEESIYNPSRVILIGQVGNESIGVLRYDLDDYTAMASIYLGTKTGMGYGKQMILAGSEWLKKNYPWIKSIEARIQYGNESSLAAFASAQFKINHLVLQKVLLHDAL